MMINTIIATKIMKNDGLKRKLITARQSAAARLGDYDYRASVCALACERRRDKGYTV